MSIALASPQPHISRAVALKALERITQRWGLKRQQLPLLLARPSRTVRSWYEHEQGGDLDQDVLERISHLVGIYDGLHRLFGDQEYADRWVSEPNASFNMTAPRELLLTGSFTALVEVRRYVEIALQR
jgi:uncharacterized protein (DUF2384 family)